MAVKDEILHIKINSDEKQAIAETAERLDIPVSQFIREAAREKIAAVPAEKVRPVTKGAKANA